MDGRTIYSYLPEGVSEILSVSSSSFIGLLDCKTVLKYPHVAGEEWDRFVNEERIYNALGSHPRIISCFGLDNRGLKLEYASKGSVSEYLRNYEVSREERLRWSRQAAEATAYIHTKNVIHCDINTNNLLLDDNLNVKLADFQGIYVDQRGETFTGLASENTKSSLPRSIPYRSDEKSDLFALGSAIYYIMTGHEPFPDLDPIEDEYEITRRFRHGEFPSLEEVLGGQIIHGCWTLAYKSVDECVEELKALEARLITEVQRHVRTD